MINMI